MTKLIHAGITDRAWRAYYNVYNAHGHDYPEAFYEEMMRIEFEELQIPCATQVSYRIFYKDVQVGKHITDMELANLVILELKVKPQLLPRHQAQLISNLKVSGKPVGLLLNFGSLNPEGQRKVLTAQAESYPPQWTPAADPNLLYPDLTLELRRAVWEVYYTLGSAFVHRVYANATHVELRLRGLSIQRLRKLIIQHRGREIGRVTFHHFIVEGKVVLAPVTISSISSSEVNKVKTIMAQHRLPLGMIVNFQNEKLEVKYVR